MVAFFLVIIPINNELSLLPKTACMLDVNVKAESTGLMTGAALPKKNSLLSLV